MRTLVFNIKRWLNSLLLLLSLRCIERLFNVAINLLFLRRMFHVMKATTQV